MDPSSRLKVRGDTFFLPSSDGSVFFRNNIGSFRMEGRTIAQWIEKLLPVFNGEHTMHDLTDGLPEQHRNHVYEIAKVLYANGYVQDVSQDRPHQLQESIVKKNESQIEFLDSFDGSGAYRFQLYRQSSVLVVGSGTFLVSLVNSLFESGLPQFHFLGLNLDTENRARIWELEQHYRKFDSEVKVDEISWPKNVVSDWSSIVEPYTAVLFVSDQDGEPELRLLNEICRLKNKVLLLAVIYEQAGLAVPLSYSNSEGDWESAWRRVHHSAIYKDTDVHTASSVAEALLANVIVFEWLKTAAEVTKLEKNNKLFLLNLETLEGNWHSFLPHPLVNGHRFIERIEDVGLLAGTDAEKRVSSSSELLPFFSQLTSTETGIFHMWEEGELRQLPLSQCSVQPVDPLSVGPALLLPEIICNGYKHEEARREAGLRGIEAYVSRMSHSLYNQPYEESEKSDVLSFDELANVGAGETVEEGVCRALQKYLMNARMKRHETHTPSITLVELKQVEDERCRYYINALTTMQGALTFGLGEDILGFPVAWLRANDQWYDAADLNVTWALRSVLMLALFEAQNKADQLAGKVHHAAINVKDAGMGSISIPACDPFEYQEVLQMAMQQLNRANKRLLVFDVTPEPFLREELAGIYGVTLREVVEE